MASSSHSHVPNVSLEDVSNSTFKQIEKMMKSTFDPNKVGRGRDAINLDHFDISVNHIQRVKNEKLFHEYGVFKDKLRMKPCDDEIIDFPLEILLFKQTRRQVDLNEIYLFHGTKKDSASRIIREGFNIDTTNPSRSLFGSGLYFAERFTKADQYTDGDINDRNPHGTPLTMLLCKVLIGNACKCGKDAAKKWKRPPPPCMECDDKKCPHGWEDRYDSVLGSGRNMLFREFVVYDARQCFPEFIITYERVGGWDPILEYDE